MSTQRWLSKLTIVVLSFAFQSCNQSKTGYVDIFKLVSGFELQKEYSAQARMEFDRVRAAIDSVVYVERMNDSLRSEAIKNELYADLSRKTENHNKEIEGMVWTRLNPYITDFGKEKGYDYIYGANGTGNVLYADKGQDITEEVIKYANNRYHDKK
jgi:outer membrane protein